VSRHDADDDVCRAARTSVIRLLVLTLTAFAMASCQGGNGEDYPGPWGPHVVAPADLVGELSSGTDKPVVVCTAPSFLYHAGHVPGAVLHGPTSTPAGHSDFVEWAKGLPRAANLVVYCGCCPLIHCPNLKPAYSALKELGFTRVRVLVLPQDFGTDWVRVGLPVER